LLSLCFLNDIVKRFLLLFSVVNSLLCECLNKIFNCINIVGVVVVDILCALFKLSKLCGVRVCAFCFAQVHQLWEFLSELQ
jgi:hypothetical protein